MLNITRSLVLSVFAATALLGCGGSTDAKFLGAWDAPGIDAVERITFNADHTFQGVSDGLAGKISFKGTWQVRGDQLEIRYDGKEPISGTVVKITNDELRLRDGQGNENFPWKRIK